MQYVQYKKLKMSTKKTTPYIVENYESDIIVSMFEVLGKRFDTKTTFEFLRDVIVTTEKRRKEKSLKILLFLKEINKSKPDTKKQYV